LFCYFFSSLRLFSCITCVFYFLRIDWENRVVWEAGKNFEKPQVWIEMLLQWS
jgi:hypothetical protein